jgi:hypothetical protein
MDVTIFWDIVLCFQYVNRRFGGTYNLHIQDRKSSQKETSVQQVARQILNSFPRNLVHIRTTRRFFPEDGNIQ